MGEGGGGVKIVLRGSNNRNIRIEAYSEPFFRQI